jgi:3,4-dihydroxy 2-butanone 4-phosphate synthase
VTDRDRARTVSALGTAATDIEGTDFAAEFRAPGHVHVLRAAPDLLADRKGHTELGLALAKAADQPPAVAGCEMLDATSGDALSVEDAKAYAERTETPLVDGMALVQEFA